MTKAIIPKHGAPMKSAFKTGKYKGGSPLKNGKKDNRNVLYIVGVQNGIAVVYFKKPNKDEEAFLSYDMENFGNPTVAEAFGINDVAHRKGEDGETALKQGPNSDWNWRQLLLIIGEDDNTPQGRRAAANAIVDEVNRNATTASYRYPKKCRFGGDLSAVPLATVDSVLLDADVLGLILAAYPSVAVSQLMEERDILATFWCDTAHGREVLVAHEAASSVGQNGDNNSE